MSERQQDEDLGLLGSMVPSHSGEGAPRREDGAMCDSGGGDVKRRYFLGPYEDGDPTALMTLEVALEDLRTWFHDGCPGDEFAYRIVEMTDAEVEKLPEL